MLSNIDIKTTNRLLLILVVPVVFYLLHIMSFIFVPLLSSMFVALLFLPIMRWLKSKGVNKVFSIIIVIILIGAMASCAIFLLRMSSREILETKDVFLSKAEVKLIDGIKGVQNYFGIESKEAITKQSLLSSEMTKSLSGPALKLFGNVITQSLTILFFVVLWLSESINFEKILNLTIIKSKFSSVKIFRRIEKDIIKFIRVKFLVSFGTGIGTGIACYFFDVSFPIFWGIFAFAINFIQMVGSFITVILCSIFAFVELEPSSSLAFFVLTITLVQVLFGSILEPIYMGKSFKINIIMVLIMLMFWGFIWGIPGMIMSIPITVFLKIVLEQFDSTRKIAQILE